MSRTILEDKIVIDKRAARVAVSGLQGARGERGYQGITFTPYVSLSGDISWTNDGDLNNPDTINIMGPQGAPGEPGADGAMGPQGPRGYSFTPFVDENGNLSWTNDGELENPAVVNIKGEKGEKGDKGDPGIGFSCEEYTFTSEGIAANDILTFSDSDFLYVVGHNHLRITVEGISLVRGIHYEEVGTTDSVSTSIQFLVAIDTGAVVNLWAGTLGAESGELQAIPTDAVLALFEE